MYSCVVLWLEVEQYALLPSPIYYDLTSHVVRSSGIIFTMFKVGQSTCSWLLMSSELQLDVRHLNRWRRHLVNAYEVKAGMVFIASKTVWSMPERFKVVCTSCKALYKCSALPYLHIVFTANTSHHVVTVKFDPLNVHVFSVSDVR